MSATLSRTLNQVATMAYQSYRGKTSNMPVSGDEKYTRIVNLINQFQRSWARDSNVDWPSRYEVRNLGTTTTGTQVYNLPADVVNLSDYVQLVDANNNTTYITVIKPETIAGYTSGCYVAGANPQKLTFLTPITSALNGLTITVPCFTMPADLVNDTDTVAVDDPDWLAYAVAAELARNDYSKEQQYPNLKGIADTLYAGMVNNAQSNSFLQPNGVVNNMPQVPDLNANYYSGWGA